MVILIDGCVYTISIILHFQIYVGDSSIHPSIYPSIHLSIYPSIHHYLSISPSIYLFICMTLSPFSIYSKSTYLFLPTVIMRYARRVCVVHSLGSAQKET